MSVDFTTEAVALDANGYEIIPLYPQSKIPAVKDWVNKHYTPADLQAGQGVAVKAGKVIAVDLDILDAAMCESMVVYIEELVGFTVSRVGKAPKVLLAYRAADGEHIRKQSSDKFGDLNCQVEVIGHGGKFTCYQIHPDTKKPYVWTDIYGGLAETPLNDLPTITQAQIDSIIEHFTKMCEAAGLENKSHKVKVTGEKKADDAAVSLGLSVDEVKTYIADEDNEDYQNWVNVGYAVFNELGDDGFEVFDEWSQGASNYDADSVEATWEAIKGSDGSDKITMRTFIKKHSLKKHARLQAIRECNDTVDIELLLNSLQSEPTNDKKAYAKAALIRWRELRGEANKAFIRTAIDLEAKDNIDFDNELNELGNAERFVREYAGEVLFVSDMGQWLKWNGYRYEPVPEVEIKNLIVMSIKASVASVQQIAMNNAGNPDFAKKAKAFQASSLKNTMINNINDIAKTDKRIGIRFKALDSNVDLLGVGNGVINLKTGEMQAPNPKDLITINTPVKFDPLATCPTWLQTVSDVFDNDSEMAAYFQRVIGYAVMGNPKENKIFILHGEGANGKSTICNTIKNVLGGHAKVTGSETFVSSGATNTGAPREDILRLAGSRFVYVSEMDDNAVLKDSLVKSVTGGEPLAARGLYSKHTVEVQPLFSCFMPTNHLPIIKNDDHGIWRRIEFIPFTVNFDKNPKFKKDTSRIEKLVAEYEGILNWIIQGALEYQRIGLQSPAKVRNAVEEYRDDMDILSQWMDDCCDLTDDEATESIDALWASWHFYASKSGDLKYISTRNLLSRRLAAKFKKFRTNNWRGFKGIKLVKDIENDDFEAK